MQQRQHRPTRLGPRTELPTRGVEKARSIRNPRHASAELATQTVFDYLLRHSPLLAAASDKVTKWSNQAPHYLTDDDSGAAIRY